MRIDRVASFVAILSSLSFASAPPLQERECECIDSRFTFGHAYATDQAARRYKVSVLDTVIDENGDPVNPNRIDFAVEYVLATFHEQAAGDHWVRVGSSRERNIPLSKDDCVKAGVDYSLFVFKNYEPGTAGAQAEPKCFDDDDNPTAWRVYFAVNSTAFGSKPISFEPDLPDNRWGEFNQPAWVTSTLTHEVLHTYNLDHPPYTSPLTPDDPGSFASKMIVRTTAGGELYSYDRTCIRQCNRTRQVRGWMWKQVGDVFERFRQRATSTFSDLAGGIGKIRGTADDAGWSVARDDGIDLRLEEDIDASGSGSPSVVGPSRHAFSPFYPVFWQSGPTDVSLIGPDPIFERPFDDWRARTQVFEISRTAGGWGQPDVLEYCPTMVGFMACGAERERVFTNRAPVVSLEPSRDLMITAWLNLYREPVNKALNREIMMSVGRVSGVLPAPTATGLRSWVRPGIACSFDTSLPFNCMLAYVPETDGDLVVRRFRTTIAPDGFVPVFEPDTHPVGDNVRTGHGVTAWFNFEAQRFFVAYRPMRSGHGQEVEVKSTVSPDVWPGAPRRMDRSIVGPQSVSFVMTSPNVLVGWEEEAF